jgi:parallel beta-helix repeat protein
VVENVSGSITLYVNTTGSGGVYTSIQGAINAANNGDTIFVFGGEYRENLVIGKTINLIGEDRDTTIIRKSGDTIMITADLVKVKDFTICGGGALSSGILVTSNYNTITNIIIKTASYGIRLSSSTGNNIIGNNISMNVYNGGIYLESSSWNNLYNNVMIDNGISITGDTLPSWNTHNIDSSNTVNGKPVYYWKNQNGGTVLGGAGQILFANCTNMIVKDQNLANTSIGIQLGFSSCNQIINNNVSSNKNYGIYLYNSNRNEITNNNALKNWCGVYISHSNENNITDSTLSFNSRLGIFIQYSNRNNIVGNNASKNVDEVGGSNIFIDDSTDNEINGNTVSLSDFGIEIVDSSENNITGNNVSNNNYSNIALFRSIDNIIANNTVSSRICLGGIYLSRSNGNYVTGNTMVGDGIRIEGYLLEHWNTHTIETTNTINGKPVYYLKNKNGGTIPSGGGQVILANSMNIKIEYQEFTNATSGIQLGFSSYNTIINNNISNNFDGIYLSDSNWNQLNSNNLTSNEIGIVFYDSSWNNITGNTISFSESTGISLDKPSSDNVIYHNNFILNSEQVFDDATMGNQWDNGYPSGGNYWSDYLGNDGFNGPDQNISGDDGIGDTPYVIDGNSKDSYPIMDPIGNITLPRPVHNIYKNTSYFKIQYAIDAADPGNTILVENGTYYENVMVNKTINLFGEDKNTTIINGGGNGNVVKITADWVNLTGFTITNSGSSGSVEAGLLIESNYNTITNTNISNNNKFGVCLWFSSKNNLLDNINEDGILIRGNNIEQWNTHKISGLNRINGKPVYYWKDRIGGTIPSGAGQVILANCTNIIIENQEVTDGFIGIELGFSSNNLIIGNNATSNLWEGIYLYQSNGNNITGNTIRLNNQSGIYLENSDRNNITGNTFSNNRVYNIDLYKSNWNLIMANNASSGISGIHIYCSSDNTLIDNFVFSNSYGISLNSLSFGNLIYHNNFINNTNQAWDSTDNGNQWNETYPIGGNFWSDYEGFDNYSGFNQDISGSDGFGDLPYTIDLNSKDKYPLMEPTLDTLPPRIYLISSTNNSIIQPGLILDFYVYDGNINFVRYSIDGGPEQPLLPPYNISTSGWIDGLHEVLIWANDMYFNSASKTFYFTVDSLNPNISINSPVNNSLITRGTILDFSIIDLHLKHVNYSINGGNNVTLSEPFNISTALWSDNNYKIQINAIDLAGNSNSSWYFFIIDNSTPLILLNTPMNNSIITGGTFLDFYIIDLSLTEVNYSINGGANISFFDPFNISTAGWPNGGYTIQINALDLAGNYNSSWYFFTIDSSPPVILLNYPQSNSFISNGTILDFSINDLYLIQVNYSINGGNNISIFEPYNISTDGWPDDNYTIQINAIDLVNNSNSSFFFFTIDSTKPIIMLNSPQNSSFIPSGTILDINVVDANLMLVNYSIKESICTPISDPFNICTLGWQDGNYTILINAIDLAGNSNSSLFFFTIDSTNPMIILSTPANNSVMKDDIILDFTVNDTNLVYVNYSINGAANFTFFQPYDISTEGWPDGCYAIQINALDLARNSQSSWFFFTFDSTKPTIILDSPDNNSIIPSSTLLEFTIEDSNLKHVNYSINDGENISASEKFNISTEEWQDSDYKVKINALDLAGNSNSVWFLFTIDSISPSITFDLSLNYSTIPVGLTIQIDISDADVNIVMYSINEGEYYVLSSPYIIVTNGWSDGSHTVYIKANDTAGNENIQWFEIIIDAVPPFVVSSQPQHQSKDIEIETLIIITFSEEMNQTDVEDYLALSPFINYTCVWEQDGTILNISFKPNKLAEGTTYNLNIGKQIKDTNGNLMLSDFELVFTTKTIPSQLEPKPSEPSFPYWILALIAIVTTILVLLFFLLRRMKREGEEPEVGLEEEVIKAREGIDEVAVAEESSEGVSLVHEGEVKLTDEEEQEVSRIQEEKKVKVPEGETIEAILPEPSPPLIAPIKPMPKLKCPKCNGIFAIELKEMPFFTDCPHCGLRGKVER